MPFQRSRRAGIHRDQLVRVRPEAEIAATLDADGKLEGLPFMPEMAKHCGQVFRVHRRADKTCVEGHAMRRLGGAVLLEGLRCDGAFHDGCQRNCLFFWKEAWLEPAAEADAGAPSPEPALPVWARSLKTREGDRYTCQSTELLGATRPLSRWNLIHFLGELRSGEITPGLLVRVLFQTAQDRVRSLLGLRRSGAIHGVKADASRGGLDLRTGDWVAVKPLAEIRATLDAAGKNRGLSFEPEMAQYSGGRFEVEFPVRKIILEQTGEMIPLASTVALKGVACDGRCTKNCPRNNTLYWREAWLDRSAPPDES